MSTRRVALVTGGARGIGKAIAIRLAEDPSGIDVAILDVEGKESLLATVVEEIESKGSKGLWITGDVSVEQDVERAIERTVSELKSLDIVRLVNTAVCIIALIFCFQMVSNAGTARIIPLIESARGLHLMLSTVFFDRFPSYCRRLEQNSLGECSGHDALLQACRDSDDQAGSRRNNHRWVFNCCYFPSL